MDTKRDLPLVNTRALRHPRGMDSQDTNPAGRVLQLIDALGDHLTMLKEEGIRTVEMSPETLRALAQPPARNRPPASSDRSIPNEGDAMSSTTLGAIAERVAACRLCGLCETRHHTVPGQGSSNPDILFIGEGPGAEEDKQGLAFVGRAGQLLTKIIAAMGYDRNDVWIGNIVKCRPPNNRVPTPDEMEACLPYLREQIALLKPKVIVCLGATAVKGLFHTQTGITKLRGQWMTFEEIDTMPTYHPAYLLRNPPAKREVWEDMKAVLQKLGRPIPGKE